MRAIRLLASIALLGAVLAGCGETEAPSEPAQGEGAVLELPEPYELREWSADADPLVGAEGRLTLDGQPVAGARIEVGDYLLWAATDEDGRFRYPLDMTLPRRYPVSVVDAADATVEGEQLASDELAALADARGAITVAHRLSEVEVEGDDRGIAITGRVTLGDEPVQPVTLYAFELTGTVRDDRGRPVEGAIVSTRTTDRDFWTFSEPSDARGRYRSNFGASDRVGSDPVPITVHVAIGDDEFAFLPEETVAFERLRSAEMDIRLPPEGFRMALPEPRSFPAARYKGVLVGATVDGRAVRPVSVTWPDENGRFELVLPERFAGATASLWAGERELLSRREARPGGAVDLADWPKRLPPAVPRELQELELPSE